MPKFWILAAALAAFALSGLSQTVTGTLECRVIDSAGAVIVGADVSVKSEETGLTARE